MEAEYANPYLDHRSSANVSIDHFLYWILARQARQVRRVHRLTLVAPRVQAAQEDPEDVGDLGRPDLDQWI